MLHITPRQLATWERAGLVELAEGYSFYELVQIQKIRDLCAAKVRPAVIRQSLEAMQKRVAGMENPLLQAGTYSVGRKRVAFRHEGRILEPVAGQFVFDFSAVKIVSSPAPAPRPTANPTDVGELFARGIALEDDPDTQGEAIACYRAVLEIDDAHAASHINLGTIFYNRQEFALAEKHYRSAVAIDARYALAHFDLGNVLDETGRVGDAVSAYKTALLLAPTYSDAHYNLALAYEKLKEPRKALRHWNAYLKLDRAGGPWAVHARAQVQQILQGDGLKLVKSK